MHQADVQLIKGELKHWSRSADSGGLGHLLFLRNLRDILMVIGRLPASPAPAREVPASSAQGTMAGVRHDGKATSFSS
jgi:hypothetical protein